MDNIPERVSLLEHRMNTAEESGREYRKSITELSQSLALLSHNINQIKWVVVCAVVAFSGPDGVELARQMLATGG